MKLIKVIADSCHLDTLVGLVEQQTGSSKSTREELYIQIEKGAGLEKNKARQSSIWLVVFWPVSLLVLFYTVYIRNGFSV